MSRLGACLFAVVCLTAPAARAQPATEQPGVDVTIDGMRSRTPGDWEELRPSTRTRVWELRVPRVAGDAEDARVIVYYFGAGQGGGLDANVKRWKGQFEAPAGKSMDDTMKTEKFKAGDVDVTLLDFAGTYKTRIPPFDPNGRVVEHPNYRMLVAYLPSKNGPYFVQMTGPARTMDKHAEGFRQWVRAFR